MEYSLLYTTRMSNMQHNYTNSTLTPECASFLKNQHQCDTLVTIRKTVAALSLIGCILIIGIIVLYQKYKIFSQRMILYLAISAFLQTVIYLVDGLHPQGTLCRFQGWWLTFFLWSVTMWACSITFYIYMAGIRSTNTQKHEWLYHLVSWGVPFFLACIPFIDNEYGPAGAWCWIEHWGWRFGIWYIPIIIIVPTLSVVYIYITAKLNRQADTWHGTFDPHRERTKQVLRDTARPLKWYPCVFLLLSIFPLVNRIQNIASSEPVFELYLLMILSSAIRGVFYAIVFMLDKETLNSLRPSHMRRALLQHSDSQSTVIQEYPAYTIGESTHTTNPNLNTQSSIQFEEATV